MTFIDAPLNLPVNHDLALRRFDLCLLENVSNDPVQTSSKSRQSIALTLERPTLTICYAENQLTDAFREGTWLTSPNLPATTGLDP